MPHRFFIAPNCITPPTVTLPDDVARQIRAVLRMRPGDEFVALDDSGQEYRVKLTHVDKKNVQGQIIAQQPAPGEPRVRLTLYQGTLKAQKFEWVLQKGSELGVSRFVPTICRRSVVRDPAALTKKQSRWAQIIREAAEQSERGKLPELADALPFEAALAEARRSVLALLPWEAAHGGSLKTALAGDAPASVALFIGPEGGFAPEEAAAAEAAGVRVISLGPRILRAETAGLAACAAIMHQLDEWQLSAG
jgi:16S rRNA (uracil1498-N3)-methyltransferase